MAARMTLKDFIEKSQQMHNNKYDYSKSVYINNSSKIAIICPEHGEFLQRASSHIQGQGCPVCAHDLRAKTCLNRYGIAQPMMTEENRLKASESVKNKYGVDNVFQSEIIKNKIAQTNLERFGVENPMQNADIQDKAKQTNLVLYGVSCSMQNENVKAKHRASVKAHYNVENSMQSVEVQEKCRKTFIAKYGVENPRQNAEINEKIKNTCLKKYGVNYPLQSSDIMSKTLNTKHENGTFDTSKPEETLYDVLCNVFGENDIIRQYSSELYSFACDFYIKSRNLYIELNASWTHVEKRNTAKNNNLNYITFWDNELRDAELWFAMNCPDGKDYDKKYSWLPERVINNINYPKPKLTGTHSNLSAIAKSYNFDIFYENEINLWNENLDYKNLTLQAFLYYNRLKYIGKLPNELTDMEILRAFTIAGIHKGYTVFDTSLMNMIATKYNIKSVCDPCAGWGERMLYCYHNNIAYHGIDINAKLQKGYNNMITDFNMTEQVIETADSALCNISGNYDAVITCPPYGNIEIYSKNGSENLDNNAFLDWWHQVVLNCNKTGIKYFCFQINQKYRDSMLKIVENCNYKLIDELQFNNNKSSHFTRKGENNIKKEFETMLVLQKI